MLTKKRLLQNSDLYLILDAQVNSYKELFEIAKKAVKNGVGILQLRDKFGKATDILTFSKKLKALCQGKALFIVNDRIDIALASSADGVHLGQEDLGIQYARKMLGRKAVIGVSCQTFAHAKTAQDNGADYLGLGSIFKTKTKPGRVPMDTKLIKKIAGNINLPVYAIGGITEKDIKNLKSFGIRKFAVCRAVCKAKNVGKAVAGFMKEI